MNKFVNIIKFSMVSALTAGLTMGTVVESAEALSPGGGWKWGSVTNAGSDPDDLFTLEKISERRQKDEDNLGQNIGFDLLLGKERISSDNGSFVFKGAIENFFYQDTCDSDGGGISSCEPINNNFNAFKLSFGVGDLKTTLNDNNTATYEILSDEFLLESNNKNNIENPSDIINSQNNQPFVAASFTLDTSQSKNPNSFINDLDTIVGEFYNQFFIPKSGKDGNNPEDFEKVNGKNKINGNAPQIDIFPPNGLPIQFQEVDYTISSKLAPAGVDDIEGDDGTFVIKEIAAKNPVKTVPEPGNIFSLLALGSLGVGALHRRKIRINSNK